MTEMFRVGDTVVCDTANHGDERDREFYAVSIQVGVPARIVSTKNNRFDIAYRFVGERPSDWIISVDATWLRRATQAEQDWFAGNQIHPLPHCTYDGVGNCGHVTCDSRA